MKYLLALQNFYVDKIPDDGTLVSKHVEADTRYEVFCNIFNCILVYIVGFLKIQNS